MTDSIAVGLMAMLGSMFMLIASIGIVRMPDLFLRLQVTSKASVMGLTCILLAVALHFFTTVVTIRAGLIICFIVLTIPVATHMLARAGYTTNVPFSDETVVNELVGQYDPRTHVLAGEEPTHWELEISNGARAIGKQVAELGLPGNVLILAIHRGGDIVVPRGQTVIQAHDKLKILASPDQLDTILDTLGADVRGLLPDTLEFPLLASTTVGQLQEFYSIQLEGAPQTTLADLLREQLGTPLPRLGETVRLGPLRFRILRLSTDGQIQTIGMSILPDHPSP